MSRQSFPGDIEDEEQTMAMVDKWKDWDRPIRFVDIETMTFQEICQEEKEMYHKPYIWKE